MVRKRWHEVNELDVGDVSEFEKPPLRDEEIIRCWKGFYTRMSPQDAARSTSRALDCSIEDVCQALEHTGQMEGVSYFAPIIRVQAAKENFYESIDDLGDTGDFEKPLTKKYRVLYKGTDGDRHIVHIEAPDDVNAGQQIAAIPDFLPTNLIEIEPMQEEADDIGDIGDFEEPYQSKLLKKFPNHSSDNKRLDYHLDMLMKGAEIDRDTGGVGMGVGNSHILVKNYDIRFKETTMEKRKRWYEANEVDPESGYIKEVPDPVEDLGDVSEFEAPEVMAATKELMQQPSYYDAWKYFSTHFHDFMQGRSGVPYGSGAFEMWWVGGPCAPDAAPSPQGTITKDDINELANEGGYQAESSEVFGLFMNTFYNNALGAMMDLEVLTYLTQKAMQIAGHIGGEEQFEGFNVFRDLSDDEKAELMGTKYAAKQVATQIKNDAQEKMNRKANMNREIQANGGNGVY